MSAPEPRTSVASVVVATTAAQAATTMGTAVPVIAPPLAGTHTDSCTRTYGLMSLVAMVAVAMLALARGAGARVSR